MTVFSPTTPVDFCCRARKKRVKEGKTAPQLNKMWTGSAAVKKSKEEKVSPLPRQKKKGHRVNPRAKKK